MSRLRSFWLTPVAAPLCIGLAMQAVAVGDEPLAPLPAYEHFAAPLIEQHCFDCHSGDDPDAGLAMNRMDGGDQFQQHRAVWKKVLRRVRAGEMPPPEYDVLDDEDRAQLTEWIEAKLAELDCSGSVDPGWVTLRRLNRSQYKNTIRDLLQVDFEPATTFPPDVLAYGFDNNADLLSLTPVLLEKYLDAARDISLEAVLVPELLVDGQVSIPKDRWEGGTYDREDARELWSNGAVEFVYEFPQAGRYILRVVASAEQAGDEPVRMAVVDGGRPVQSVSVHATREEQETLAFAFDVPAGKRRLGVAFLNDYYSEDVGDRNLFVRQFQIVGPVDSALRAAPPAHRRWFAEGPNPDEWRDDRTWRPQVRKNLIRLTTSAFRRPAPEAELDRLMALVDSRRLAGDTYERAMQVALQAILVSPRFLFIGNVDEPQREASKNEVGYQIDEYELASRLSYFLWSSMPDAQLLRLAGEGNLRAQLDVELRRMLRDRRAKHFVANFAGQWLGTWQLAEFEPDESQFGDFDADLRDAMMAEAEMVFAEVVRRDLPIATLLNAEFTYLNARLAEHYGIEGVSGEFMRRVALAELPEFAGVRGGVLAMAGVLATTSNPDRTSPVKRGKWVLAQLLNAEPPAPPPGVGTLDEVAREHDQTLSIREQMALHRADPSCAVCHKQMDVLGLALENYDAVGRWREADEVGPIDASGELPSGERLEGADGLRQVLLARRDEFRRCLAEKMLTYALGRGLEYYDECAVRQICDEVEAVDDRMQSLIKAIVLSTPFQQRRYSMPSSSTED